MIWIQSAVLLFVFFVKDKTATASVTNSYNRGNRYTAYPRPQRGYNQQSLNTPSNTNGKVNHNYFLIPSSGRNNNPNTYPSTVAPKTTVRDAKQTSQSTYQSQETQFANTGSGSGTNNFGNSVTHSHNVNTGGNSGVFQNQQVSSNFANYQVTLQGTLLNNPSNQGGSWTSGSFYPQNSYHNQYSVPLQTPSNSGQYSGVHEEEWFTSPFEEFVEIIEVSNRALLEEAASDVTGQTHCLDVPRCSYVPLRKGCEGHEFLRTADGTCNNVHEPLLGSAFQPFKRYLPPRYDDGAASPRNSSVVRDQQGRPLPLPSPRLITRTVHLVNEEASDVSGLLMQFGQFIDHDITGTSSITGEKGAIICCGEKKQNHEACMPIPIPPGDTHFTDSSCINFVRSLAVTDNLNNTLVPREQRNEVTSFLDASVVYGSTEDQISQLRSFQQGLLHCSDGEMLPLELGGCAAEDGLCFTSGDTRVNEIPGLGGLHLVFHRQHNRLARALLTLLPNAAQYPSHILDEAIFQTARRILGAQLQHVTYTEWLPLVLGPFTMNHYDLGQDQGQYSYDSSRNPQIANVFATAAFRFGHSLVPAAIMWGDEAIPLHEAFSNPKWVRTDADKVIRGLLHVQAQTRDQYFVTGLRNRLFESSPRRGLDLIAMNIQRGRDHGLPPYNAWRETCGLPLVHSFNDSALGSAGPSLREVYLSVDDIDLFTGALSEPSLPGALVGPTLACLIGKQFADLKHADRFFYLTTGQEGFTQDQLRFITHTTMFQLLCANTQRLPSVQRNPFLQVSSDLNPLVPCGQLKQLPSLGPWKQELISLIISLNNSNTNK